MQIAVTKKLADALGIKPAAAREDGNPLFTWTANWTRVWDNRRADDMLVLVNNATRFTVAIYQVKRKDIKKASAMLLPAIKNTLLAMNLNPELVEEYLRMAGEAELVRNHNRRAAAWVSRAGLECAFTVGRRYDGNEKMLCDTVGLRANWRTVGYSSSGREGFTPYQTMIDALVTLTGKQAYKYRAFELLVTLDLEVYKAIRRIIVSANIPLIELHQVLQFIFSWENCHLHDFTVYDEGKPITRIVPFAEDLEYDKNAVLAEGYTLAKIFPQYSKMVYAYDFGDNWRHEIQLVRTIAEHSEASPYLLEASGQTPPEDVGGVSAFGDFRNILLDPSHPDYDYMKKWAGYWTLELSDRLQKPRVVPLWY